MKNDTKSILLLAICIGLIASLGASLEYLRSDGYSVKLFSDWDEAPYLVSARQIANDSSSIVNLAKADYLPERGNPSNVTDYLIGSFALDFNVKATTVALLLDFLCVSFSFFFFHLFFFAISKDRKIASISSLVALFFPWIFSPLAYLPSSISFLGNIALSAHETFPSTSPLRAVHTQVSFPIFALTLYAALIFSRNISPFKNVLLSAFTCGLLLYTYVFAWLSAGLISGLLFLRAFFTEEQRSLKAYFIWLITFCLISFPGMQFLFSSRDSEVSFYGDFGSSLSEIVYFPLEKIVVVTIIVLLLKNHGLDRERAKIPLSILVILTIADGLLTNLQVFTSSWVAPYHFSQFYLDPLFSGTTLTLLLPRLLRTKINERLNLYQATLIALVAILSFKHYTFPWHPEDTTKQGLFAAVEKYVGKEQTIAVPAYISPIARGKNVLSFSHPLPYLISALSNREVFGKIHTHSVQRTKFTEREAIFNWYDSGKIALIGNCIESPPVVTPDVIRSAHTFLSFLRHKDCIAAQSILEKLTPCSILRKTEIDFLLRVNKAPYSVTGSINDQFYEPVWSSKNELYQILRIDKLRMEKEYCQP